MSLVLDEHRELVEDLCRLRAYEAALTSDPAYKSTDGDQPRAVTSLLFLDFSQLLRLVEQTGLASSMRLGALQADLAKVRAVGLHSTRGESDTTAELFLQIP